MFWLSLFLIIFGLNNSLFASSAWVVGPEEIIFIDSHHHLSSLTRYSVQSSLVDPDTCHLWFQTGNKLMKMGPNLEVIHRIDSTDQILGDKLTTGYWISVNQDIWTLRDKKGHTQSRFPAPFSAPSGLVSLNPNSFWSLDFKKENNSLRLISFDLGGNVLASYPVSKKAELWSLPFLLTPPGTNELWIGYTAGTMSHSYSPQLERWSTEGKILNKLSFSHRGLFLGMVLTPRNTVIIARDIPSDPFTVPLYTFIDEFNRFFDSNPLFSIEDNYIIRSLDSYDRSLWTYEQSILGSANKKIVKRDFISSQEKIFQIKESAWKIHACSVQ